MEARNKSRTRRHQRVRAKITGSAKRPRLVAAISSRHVMAQLVDDNKGHTLAYSSTVGQKLDHNLSTRAVWVGEDIAKKAKSIKIKQVVFDRGPKRYHGRIKILAETARAGGLEF